MPGVYTGCSSALRGEGCFPAGKCRLRPKVGTIGKMLVIRSALTLRGTFRVAPVHARRNGTIYLIPQLNQQLGVTAVECPAPGAMAEHFVWKVSSSKRVMKSTFSRMTSSENSIR